MTTDDKLQEFTELCILDARRKSETLIDRHNKMLEESFSKYEEDTKLLHANQLKAARDSLEKKYNKLLSNEQLKVRQQLSKTKSELYDKIFVELIDKIANYISSHDYLTLLDRQIEAALKFAGSDEIIIYIDSTDESRLHELCIKHNTDSIKISEHSFMGGTIAYIINKNIRIDNSFARKLELAKANFTFKPGGISYA